MGPNWGRPDPGGLHVGHMNLAIRDPSCWHWDCNKMDQVSPTTLSKAFLWKKNCTEVKISLKFVHRGLVNNRLALVQAMAWCRTSDKPLMEAKMTHVMTSSKHHFKTFSVLLDHWARNSSVTAEFPSQRPVTQSFDVFFYLSPNKRVSKQPRHWWFETPSCSLWHYCNANYWHMWSTT